MQTTTCKFRRIAERILAMALMLPVMFISCSDEDETGRPENDGPDEEIVQTHEDDVYQMLLGNFYETESDGETIAYVPGLGVALDEARPSVRFVESDSYESAAANFEMLVSGNESSDFVNAEANGIRIAVPGYGDVRFSRSTEQGSVARIDVSLKNARPYTVYYLPASSFPENEGFAEGFYSLGDVVECTRNDGAKFEGIIYHVDGTGIRIASSFMDYEQVSDSKKTLLFTHRAPSVYEWCLMRDAFGKYRDVFEYTKKNHDTPDVEKFFEAMDSRSKCKNKYLLVNRNDYESGIFWCFFVYSWYSKAMRIKRADLLAGTNMNNIRTEKVWYGFRWRALDTDCLHIASYYFKNYEARDNVRRLFPNF